MKKWIFGLAFLAVVVSAVYPQLSNAQNKAEEISQPLQNIQIYNDNSSIDKNKLMTKEVAIEKVHIEKDGKLLSAELVSWNKFSNDVLGKSNSLAQISNERQVWVVKVSYPKGIDTKGGYFKNATQISVFDAETKEILNVTTQGDSPSRDHK